MTSRANLQMFAGDLITQRAPITIDRYAGLDSGGVVFSDGAGCRFTLSGQPRELRRLLTTALILLDQADPQAAPTPDPSAAGGPQPEGQRP